MVISHQYKYLFIETPHTASTAIHRELCELYDGEAVLRKHSHYYEFEQNATEAEKRYLVFAGIRNPLDIAVTRYVKFETDHNSLFSDPSKLVENGGAFSAVVTQRFEFAQNPDHDFADYFRRYHRLPYNSIEFMSLRRCDRVIRFENLQEDFSSVLEQLGIEQVRPLPERNKTIKKKHFTAYYTDEIIPQAKRVMAPYMREWGYDFPQEWGDVGVQPTSQLGYDALNQVRYIYWKNIKFSKNPLVRWFRQYR